MPAWTLHGGLLFLLNISSAYCVSFSVPELWVLVSVAAAAFQTLRFMMQKVLSSKLLTPTGATFARFVYSAPIIALLTAIYISQTEQGFPILERGFWAFASTGAVAQVLATICVVSLFKSRNFAVGVTLMKSEVILSALVGFILLGEGIGLTALAAITLGLVGVVLLSTTPDTRGWHLANMLNRSVALGLGSGVLFAVSAVCYRGASQNIISSDHVLQAGVTLSAVTCMQMIGMALWFWLRDVDQLRAVWRARRSAVWIGLLSLAGSYCWFFAFTLQPAALVKAVGQVELILSLIVSTVIFGERSSSRELAGIAVLGGSILMLVLVV